MRFPDRSDLWVHCANSRGKPRRSRVEVFGAFVRRQQASAQAEERWMADPKSGRSRPVNDIVAPGRDDHGIPSAGLGRGVSDHNGVVML